MANKKVVETKSGSKSKVSAQTNYTKSASYTKGSAYFHPDKNTVIPRQMVLMSNSASQLKPIQPFTGEAKLTKTKK